MIELVSNGGSKPIQLFDKTTVDDKISDVNLKTTSRCFEVLPL